MFDDAAQILAEALLNACWQGVAITALVWLALRLVRGPAAARFCMWWLTLAAVLALPWFHRPAAGFAAAATRAPLVTLSTSFSIFLLCAWAAGTAGMLVRLLWSYAYVRWLARTAAPLEEEYQRRAAQLGAKVQLCASPEAGSPIVIGLLRPIILLPDGLAERLDESELDQIILHEWAHIRRRDPWTNLLLEFLKALFFFHPAIWWIGRALALEREMACDDAVVVVTRAPAPYAGCLAKLVEMTARAPARLSQSAAGDARALVLRVERLLAWQRVRGFSTLRMAAVAAVLAAAVLASTQAPALVHVDSSASLALEPPRPAIELNRRMIVAEERLRAADILLEAANRRLRDADGKMRRADRQMRMAAIWSADSPVVLPRVSVSRCVTGPRVLLFWNEI